MSRPRTAGWRVLLVAALSAWLTSGCSRDGILPERGMYYWRTTYRLSRAETRSLEDLGIRRLYLRVADVEREPETGRLRPRAKLQFGQSLPAGLEVIPVFYLKNEVFEAMPGDPALAEHLHRLLSGVEQVAHFRAREVQVDCDWTERTRDRYFLFCRTFAQRLHEQGATLSATIRLHQVKYRERTGVPPVDRGMLMFYNVGSLARSQERNSIFNAADAGRYLHRLDSYPLSLDVAVGIFSWVVHFRDGRVQALIEKWPEEELAGHPELERLSPGKYRCRRSHYRHGHYLRQGDLLIVEHLGSDTQRQLARTLRRALRPRGPMTVSLFDLDERNPTLHARADLETLFDRFPALGPGPFSR